ncbi:TPA: hypothetical protein OUB92_003156 [Morganella morganii]|nr:hypothetical protein [Morganella morganii]HDS7240993.1 hypothetical protein [Morganella morganii subsp. morganii]
MSLSYSNALIVANGKKPHTALVLNDNEVIDTVAAYTKKGRTGRPLRLVDDLVHPDCSALPEPHSKYPVIRNNRTRELPRNSEGFKL